MTKNRNYKKTKNGLVLTGGGARASYQVGVLSAITKFVPRNHGIPFPVICGTSAGAINSTALACYASCFHLGVKKLEWVWRNLNTDKIYHSNATNVFGHIFRGLAGNFQADYANKVSRSLLDNSPLRLLLNQVMDFERIDKNISRGYLSALSVTASSYSTSDSISFYQAEKHIPPWFRVKRRGEKRQINCDHLIASSAIPLVFPAVRIRNEYYGDGSVHQLSPLSPAIHLGAKKLLVVGVDQPMEPIHIRENNPHPPTTATIAGHLLDTIFTDTLQSDLERMERINKTIELIPPEKRSKELSTINSLVINPSHDFNAIAVEYYEELPLSIRLLLRSAGINNNAESSLISYLLFEKNYCNELIKLGYKDAMEKESQIRSFLSI